MTTLATRADDEQLSEPQGGGEVPVVYLILARTEVEQDLCNVWIDRHQPDASAGRIDRIAVTDGRSPARSSARSSPPLPLIRRLGADDDPLLVPVRAAWLPPGGAASGAARLRDLLLGNPRRPGTAKQLITLRRHPERYAVISGEPASASELRRRFEQRVGASAGNIEEFASFVTRQAALAAERAERELTGSRYKVPHLVVEEILATASFKSGVSRLAAAIGRAEQEILRDAEADLREMAAGHSKYVIDLIAALYRRVLTMGYDPHIDYDRRQFETLRRRMRDHPVVFLPSHRTYLDPIVLSWVLHEQNLPHNHTFGGANIKFFPVSSLFRSAGGIFIRRSFRGDPVYRFVLRQYLGYVLEHRFNLEWYMEGGRSRTGKLLPPKMGLLKYVVDAYLAGRVEDLLLQPVAITYDHLYDVSCYVTEARGGLKTKEDFRFFLDYLRSLRQGYGRVHVNLAEPISLREALGSRRAAYSEDVLDPTDDPEIDLQKVAFEVAVRINQVTPITATAVVAMVMLGHSAEPTSRHAITAEVAELAEYIARRRLPAVPSLVDAKGSTAEVIDSLVGHGVVVKGDRDGETVFSIPDDQQLAAAYYRNSIVHFFVNSAIAELALLKLQDTGSSGIERFWDEVMALRDLLKFEFFFPGKGQFRRDLSHEMATRCPGWVDDVSQGPDRIGPLMDELSPLNAHRVLRPFLEAYLVTADALASHGNQAVATEGAPVDEPGFMAECLELGRQYCRQGLVHSAESVSQVLFATAVRLADHRHLLSSGPELGKLRQDFAKELSLLSHRAQLVSDLSNRTRSGAHR